MARSNAVWGIDIGQCALKAMRCRAHDDSDKIIVEAFDFIEYPKILTQPDAVPAELIADALKLFLSRNNVTNDRVAVSVPGQNGLARFIKLPPVEAKKIPDIVRYEAKQQIPFDLNDVIWDYQRMGGGAEEEGFALETEIGLFAMKRDAVFRALEPFQKAGIEVDAVQLAPLSLYNFVLFDQLRDLPGPEEYDPEDPPESVVLVSLGTDSTDLVVTNGFRVWQRSIPLGGSHFTKALTKDLKLTFAKAEHLKRNATTAQDPKAVFQAMRPVFNDLQTELQRSLGFFSNIDRTAKIGRVIALGNAFKLPGLRRYLSQSLGYELDRMESFRGLVGNEVIGTPAFKDNLLSFGVCYGLVLQELSRGGLRTNLLPKEITRERLIRAKKPWAVAAAAAIMLACSISYAAYSVQYGAVKSDIWSEAEKQVTTVSGLSSGLKSQYTEALNAYRAKDEIGKHLVANVENRTRWLELLQGINECLPADPPPVPKEITQRNQVLLTNIDCQPVDDAAKWYAVVKRWYVPPGLDATAVLAAREKAAAAATGAAGAAGAPNPAAPAAVPAAAGVPSPGSVGTPAVPADDPGPSGPGYIIIRLAGHHYHNGGTLEGAVFVRDRLLKNLFGPKMQQIGVSYPVLIKPDRITTEEINQNPAGGGFGPPNIRGFGPPAGVDMSAVGAAPLVPPVMGGGALGAAAPAPQKPLLLPRFNFLIQFLWKPTPPSERKATAPATVAGAAVPAGTSAGH